MVKKCLSLLLVSLLLIHLAGFYVYFFVRLGDLRMTMREKLTDLPAQQLEAIVIPVNEFRSTWLKEREMEWQGKMYDIARMESSANSIIIYGLHDKDEDNLLNMLSAVVDMSERDSRPAPAAVVQFFMLKFVVCLPLLPEPAPGHALLTITPYLALHSSIPEAPAAPPPRA